MTCSKCRAHTVLVENVGGGKTKKTCQSCGHSEIVDNQGRSLLTDDRPQRDDREYLIEG